LTGDEDDRHKADMSDLVPGSAFATTPDLVA
jgi:hypothetical protein